MPGARDVVVIGAGHNGLVAAFYLAQAGYKPLVLERRPQAGGAAITEEFHPGFRSSILAHAAGPIRADVVRDMQLERHGLKLITPDVAVVSFSPDGRVLTLYQDLKKSTEEIARFSPKDATRYAEFRQSLAKVSQVIGKALTLIPPSIDQPSKRDLWDMLQTGRAIRRLGKKDMYRLLRWGPMAVADLVSEYFDTELLRATLASRGIFGTFLGPWSAGSSLVLLIRAAADRHPAGAACFAEGGMGAITQAMAAAAQQAGAEIRTGVDVIEISVGNGAAHGVVLSNGEQIHAKAIVSNADPKRTLLKLVDPIHLAPNFVAKLEHYRMPGTVAKVNLALSGLPDFVALHGNTEALQGRIHIGPEIDYLERAFDEAKYGNFSREPYLEIAIPSLTDPSLAPPGKHVMSIYMQYAPYKLRDSDWETQRVALGDTVVRILAQYAPNLPQLILHHQIITPQDLEDVYGLTGGHIFHGELALDQFFTMRPLLDWARYSTPIANLFLCGSGTHPGTGLTGGSGANAANQILQQLKKK